MNKLFLKRIYKAFAKRWKLTLISAMLPTCFLLFWFSLPGELFDRQYSTVILDRNGHLLGAAIADDGQWRFPPGPDLPEKFKYSIILYEDNRFFRHIGVDPAAVARALRQNMKAGEIVSGASTITMQLIRLSRHNRERTYRAKIIEMIFALRIELMYRKEEILSMFAAIAPFGGNVVGLEAASWRYFGREPHTLSWAECAMLAVLPNNPSLIHPGKNRDLLKIKRDRLLDKLRDEGIIDRLTCDLSKLEDLPPKPHALPMLAPHLLAHAKKTGHNGQRIRTTLDFSKQVQALEIIERHHKTLAGDGILNAAAVVLDVETGSVVAYIGNSGSYTGGKDGSQVDIIRSSRSTGSILKPLLYASMLEAGEILPTRLVPDVPTRYSSFAPENFSRTYEGAVPAYRALARSLNIPAVRMLQDFGVDRFYSYLRRMGMSTLHRPAHGYGLSLILGGAEGSLWELTGIYAGLVRNVNRHNASEGKVMETFEPSFYMVGTANGDEDRHNNHVTNQKQGRTNWPLSAGASWLTLKAMVEVERPVEDNSWRDFSSSQEIAWKTGTSIGFRDAWSIGVTPRYAVGVWVGNADGEGRPGIVGGRAAAPIMFDLYDMLDQSPRFRQPDSDLVYIEICSKSGYRAGINCEETEYTVSTKAGLKTAACPYCRSIHLDADLKWQVDSGCEQVSEIRTLSWFVLPPAMEYFYKKRHSDYKPLPLHKPGCKDSSGGQGKGSMSIIYPGSGSRIYVPLEFDSKRGRTVFKAAHRDPDARIFWHLDDRYEGATYGIHQMSFSPLPGTHTLTLVDEKGELEQIPFIVLSAEAE